MLDGHHGRRVRRTFRSHSPGLADCITVAAYGSLSLCNGLEAKMLTQETNERLTRVGPGTPMGNLLRRYWFPIGSLQELLDEPVQPIRLLGEDLTLFRSSAGEIGIIA